MMHHIHERVEYFFLAAVFAVCTAFAIPAIGQDQSPRKDFFLGNPHDGVVMERAENGDLILQAVPAPKPYAEANENSTGGITEKIVILPPPAHP